MISFPFITDSVSDSRSSHASRWDWTSFDFCFRVPVLSISSKGDSKKKGRKNLSLFKSFRELTCV